MKKPKNEDSIFFGNRCLWGRSMDAPEAVAHDETACLIGVADGVGGHNAGETASRLCVEAVAGLKEISKSNVDSLLKNLNREIYEKSVDDSSLQGMGTTVAGLGLGDDCLFAFNVGDSRVYSFHAERGLERVTVDDSLRERGDLETRTPMPLASSNVITQALGGRKTFKEITPNHYDLDAGEDGLYLICSDGLNDMVEDDRIEEILGAPDAASELVKTAGSLLRAALDGGGRDNVSIVLASHSQMDSKVRSDAQGWLGRLLGRDRR
tara:strand:+ start:60 stop:857 length:798 start_codon:yes stop_codon:yes gene_type:complete